jgi:ribosomal protein S18 acetylase RimI-like enzyme
VDNLLIRPYRPEDEKAAIKVWDECGLIVPQNNPRRDIERKLRVDPQCFLVGILDGKIVATCMAGYEGHRGWINYLAVSRNYRRKGIGRSMMEEAEARLRALGCAKINLQVRTGNRDVIEFYKKIGFQADDVVSLGKRLEHDG